MDLCWEHGQLRLYDPASRSYLRTHDDVLDALDAAESQRDTAETQRDAEREARIAAEARIRQLEQELSRRSE